MSFSAPPSPTLRPRSDFGDDLESYIEHVKNYREYTELKSAMEKLKRNLARGGMSVASSSNTSAPPLTAAPPPTAAPPSTAQTQPTSAPPPTALPHYSSEDGWMILDIPEDWIFQTSPTCKTSPTFKTSQTY